MALDEVMKVTHFQIIISTLLLSTLLCVSAQSQWHRSRRRSMPAVPAGCRMAAPIDVGPLDGKAISAPLPLWRSHNSWAYG